MRTALALAAKHKFALLGVAVALVAGGVALQESGALALISAKLQVIGLEMGEDWSCVRLGWRGKWRWGGKWSSCGEPLLYWSLARVWGCAQPQHCPPACRYVAHGDERTPQPTFAPAPAAPRPLTAQAAWTGVVQLWGVASALVKSLPWPHIHDSEKGLLQAMQLLLASVFAVPLICKLPGGSPVLGFLVRGCACLNVAGPQTYWLPCSSLHLSLAQPFTAL